MPIYKRKEKNNKEDLLWKKPNEEILQEACINLRAMPHK